MTNRWGHTGCVLLLALIAAVGAAAAPNAASVLIDAVRAGDGPAVAAALRKGANVNATTSDGATALHWAAYRDDLELVDRLLRAGANVNATNRYGVAPISLAAVNGNVAVLKRMLEAGADLKARLDGETVLMKAARTGGRDVVRLLVARGADVNATTGEDSGVTALMIAAASNNATAIRALVEAGASVSARTMNPAVDNGTKGFKEGAPVDMFRRRSEWDEPRHPRQFTAFLFAARAGNIDAMKALLEAGASVNETLANGMSALVLAVTSNKLDAAAFLLDHGADPNANGNGWTALHQLAYTRRPNLGHNAMGPVSRDQIDSVGLAKKLVAMGADVNARQTQPMSTIYAGRSSLYFAGNTPFLLAAHRIDVDYMRLLVTLGADPLRASDDGTTPLMAVAGCGLWAPGENPGKPEESDEGIKFLLGLGADPTAVNAYGDTTLHCAGYGGATSGVEALAVAGAKLDAKNLITPRRRPGTTAKVGWTPLMIADGIAWNGGFKQQLETAKVLRRLMQERGLSTEYTPPTPLPAADVSGGGQKSEEPGQ